MIEFLRTKSNILSWISAVAHVLSLAEQARRAEVIFALKCVDANFSFKSNDGNSLMFPDMFPDSEIAKLYKMESSKSAYVINHGIEPYMRSLIKEDVQKSVFVFLFDETTTSQIKKQYDGHVSYFSNTFKRIVTRYIGSCFTGHCTSDDLLSDFNICTEKASLDLNYLLDCSMDGPKVNFKFLNKLKEQLRSQLNKQFLMEIGSCNLHKVNNSFLKFIDALDFEYDGFACDICFFFKISAARREDFQTMSLETDLETDNFIRHSKIRWLSIGKVAQRIVDQWPNILEYFIKFVPAQKEQQFKKVQKTDRFRSILKVIKNEESKIFLLFAIYICSLVEEFIKLFQSSEPVIHLLYPAIGDLLYKIMSNFVPTKELQISRKRKTTSELGKIDLDKITLLKLDEINFGNEANLEIKKMAKKGKDPSPLKTQFKKAYVVLVKSLQDTLPCRSDTLRYLQYLHPNLKKQCQSIIVNQIFV